MTGIKQGYNSSEIVALEGVGWIIRGFKAASLSQY